MKKFLSIILVLLICVIAVSVMFPTALAAEPISISNCDTNIGWTDGTNPATVDTEEKAEGTGSVSTSRTDMAQLKCQFESRDFTDVDSITFSLYLQNSDLLNNAAAWGACIDLGNGASDKLIRWWLGVEGKHDFADGWQTVTLALSSGSADSGAGLTDVDQFRIYVYPNPNGYKMNVDNLVINPKPQTSDPGSEHPTDPTDPDTGGPVINGLISNCDTNTGWTDGADPATVDTSEKAEGTGSVSVSKTGMAQLKCQFETLDCTKVERLQFSLYLSDAGMLNNAGAWGACIDFGSGSTDKLVRWWLGAEGRHDFINGWQTVTLTLSGGAADAGFDIREVNQFRIYAADNASGAKMNVDNLRVIYFADPGSEDTTTTKSNNNSANPDKISLTNCDSVDRWACSPQGVITLDTADKTEGAASIKFKTPVSDHHAAMQWGSEDASVDLSDMAYLEFDVYISDLNLISSATDAQIEIRSGLTPDDAELYWDLDSVKTLRLKQGWNHVRVALSAGRDSMSAGNKIDLTKVCFFRFYVVHGLTSGPDLVTKLDNIFASRDAEPNSPVTGVTMPLNVVLILIFISFAILVFNRRRIAGK